MKIGKAQEEEQEVRAYDQEFQASTQKGEKEHLRGEQRTQNEVQKGKRLKGKRTENSIFALDSVKKLMRGA